MLAVGVVPAPFMTLAPTAAAEPGDAGELTSDICSESFIVRPTPVRFVIGAAAAPSASPARWVRAEDGERAA